jgi:hypothetical protein
MDTFKRFFIFILLISSPALAVKTEVILSREPEALRSKAETVLTRVLNACNQYREAGTPLHSVEKLFCKRTYPHFLTLVEQTRLYASQRRYAATLVHTASGDFEVRGIRVRVSMGETRGSPYQSLVFVLAGNSTIMDIHFAIDPHHYQSIIQEGEDLDDLAYREKILHFIETYRTAYNKKDLTFVERTLSDDALIIVGRVITSRPNGDEYLDHSFLNDEKIEFIKKSKNEYLTSLRRVFARNDFIKVGFDRIEIQRHPRHQRIYGVRLKQRWRSSTYSDEGYLFLMVDFLDPQKPVIHVRAWQPRPLAPAAIAL